MAACTARWRFSVVMSATSTASSAARRSPRTSAIRARQRSMAAIFAVTTSKSTTAHPPEERALGLAAQDLDVFIEVQRAAEEGMPPGRVAVHEEPAGTQHLPAQNGRGLLEVHEVDLAAEHLLQLACGVEALDSRRAPAEQARQVEVRVLSGLAAGLGAEQPEGIHPEPELEEVSRLPKRILADHGLAIVAEPALGNLGLPSIETEQEEGRWRP